MPFCSNCGRKLEENEVCTCQSQNTQPVQPAQPAPQDNAGQPAFQQYDQYGRPMYTATGHLIQYPDTPQQQKKSSGCLVVAIVVLIAGLFVAGILAAILVPSMLGYVKKSNTAAANAYARSLFNASNAALCEMDEMDKYIDGYHIITSDGLKHSIVSGGFDEADFLNTMEYYNDEIDEYNWFLVIERGVVTYTACTKKDSKKYIGSYPNPTSTHTGVADYTGKYNEDYTTLEQLYDVAARNLP